MQTFNPGKKTKLMHEETDLGIGKQKQNEKGKQEWWRATSSE